MEQLTHDAIVWGLVAFTLGIVIFTAFYMGNTAVNAMLANPQVNSSKSTVTAFQGGQQSFAKFDKIFFAFFIGTTMAIIVSGFFVSGHPIFMIFYFIILVIGVVASSIASNVWHAFVNTIPMISQQASFPITMHIMSLLPMYVAAVGMIGCIVMFAKPYMFQ